MMIRIVVVIGHSGSACFPADQLQALDASATIAELMEQMKHLSADDLQDDVHRRFEYRLCRPCQRRFLANPLGKPREVRAGTN